MNAQNNISRIRNAYNPDQQDVAVGADGQPVLVTWAEYALLEMIVYQQAEIDALKLQVAHLVKIAEDTTDTCGNLSSITEIQRARIEQMERQVARLVEATPSAGPPPNDGSNRGRHKLFKT